MIPWIYVEGYKEKRCSFNSLIPSPVLHEISREWYDIRVRDEKYYKKQVFSGKCEDCGILSANLKMIDGRLLCDDCIDALKYEE